MDRFPSAVTTARHVEFRDTIQWNKFADGFPNLFIEDVRYMAGKDGKTHRKIDKKTDRWTEK